MLFLAFMLPALHRTYPISHRQCAVSRKVHFGTPQLWRRAVARAFATPDPRVRYGNNFFPWGSPEKEPKYLTSSASSRLITPILPATMSSQEGISVLVVCLGNICRSPLGEAVLKHVAKERGLAVSVDSAGTSRYHIGEDPDDR